MVDRLSFKPEDLKIIEACSGAPLDPLDPTRMVKILYLVALAIPITSAVAASIPNNGKKLSSYQRDPDFDSRAECEEFFRENYMDGGNIFNERHMDEYCGEWTKQWAAAHPGALTEEQKKLQRLVNRVGGAFLMATGSKDRGAANTIPRAGFQSTFQRVGRVGLNF